MNRKILHNADEVIVVENLTKKFGNFTAVDAISFEVKRGEIFGFLGANGAGKTTAMRMLCGLSIPSGGKGMVAGYDIAHEQEKIKKNFGYMSQKFSLYDDLKVWENIELFGGIYGMKDIDIKRKTNELMLQLQFENERDKLVKSLPLGVKQKLAFSVAIFHNPQIVFLDEPTGGVEPIPVFVTTHCMDEAEYCDRVSIMVDGKIEALDSPKNLKNQFQATNMNEVFQQLARKATRADS